MVSPTSNRRPIFRNRLRIATQPLLLRRPLNQMISQFIEYLRAEFVDIEI
jgi:hypothetical protein